MNKKQLLKRVNLRLDGAKMLKKANLDSVDINYTISILEDTIKEIHQLKGGE